jgi:diguanylate cyclase (GGDEF)-like protein
MNVPPYKRDRPTIGILAGWSARESTVPDYYISSVFRGILSAAQIKGCHLMLGSGVGRVVEATNIYPAWPEISPEADFVPVGPWNTDGLIVFTPLRNQERSTYIQKLIKEGHPVVFIAPGEQGPTIEVDNDKGIHQAVEHLIGHGHRRIAFIAGSPIYKGDSGDRLNAFRSAMAEHKLNVDPKLVQHGWHTVPGGYAAMQELLTSRVKFSAVVASNDNSAIGAMQAIREAGLRIPDDIAIIGFDDQPDSAAQTPPLATVHVPLGVIGEQALVMLLDHLTKQTPLESVKIPARLIPRRSCGCIPQAVFSVNDGAYRHRPATRSKKAVISSVRDEKARVVEDMLAVLPAELRFPGGELFHQVSTLLVDGFYTSLEKVDAEHFQKTLMDFLNQLDTMGGMIDPWQEMISVLHREMTRVPIDWKRSGTRRLAESLLHQVRVAISESAVRQDQQHGYQRDIAAKALSELTAQLSTFLDQHQAIEYLDTHLAGVGIRHSRVAIFKAEADDPVAGSIALNKGIEDSSRRFPSREFPPRGLYPPDELLGIVLLPLVFQNEALGYVAFDAGNLETCSVIATQLAATIKTSQLHAQVTELSLTDALTGLHNRRFFDLFLKNEISRHRRFAHGLVIIMMDIDNFKEYNDTYGHPAGDVALQCLAKCLSNGRRGTDLVARLGGDEFIIILPETDLHGARKVISRIHASVADLSDLERPITLSIGLTILHEKGVDAETLVKQADIALYEAKRNGRNQIVVYKDLI